MKNLKFALLLVPTLMMGACALPEDGLELPELTMDLPDSLTGGKVASKTQIADSGSDSGDTGVDGADSGEPDVAQSPSTERDHCRYVGHDIDRPFHNGYRASRFLLAHTAAWTCIAKKVALITVGQPADDEIYPTDNVKGSEDYDVSKPTHYRISSESENNRIVRLYYGFTQDEPPTVESLAAFYLTWSRSDGGTSGLLTFDTLQTEMAIEPTEPVGMRMEFDINDETHTNDMYVKFPDDSEMVNGFRTKIVKDKTKTVDDNRFTIQALLDVKQQWRENTTVVETPLMSLYTVADREGEGASMGLMEDVAVDLPLNANNHLGEYLFDKKDQYYFHREANGRNWDYINKTVSQSEYRGNRTTPATGGSWVPFNPSLDMIITALELPADYFTNNQCESYGDSCTEFLNAVFHDGFASEEANRGENPNDWRTLAMQAATFLDTVYPNGVDWSDGLMH
jgi:hypothetical protein